MTPQQSQTNVTLPALSLPKGGGALTGIRQSIETIGVTGQAGLTIPLPLSPGRGHDPSLAIQYASQQGQSTFGLGWDLPLPAISLRTHFGVPHYDGQDQLVAPNGEVMMALCNDAGEAQIEQINELAGVALSDTWQVETFMPRIMDSVTLYQRWSRPDAQNAQAPFWLVRTPDGGLAIYGYSAVARVADPRQPDHIASWLLEETVAPNGEHIYYQYRPEDAEGLTPQDLLRDHSAQRYLQRVCYGNPSASALPFLLSDTLPDDWMFELWFDYGEYAFAEQNLPQWNTPLQPWTRRADPFSTYHYGFEIRSLRLCRQVIMYHRFTELGETPQPVARLRLHYEESDTLTLLQHVDQLGHRVENETLSLPAIHYLYSRFSPAPSEARWESLLRMNALCDNHHFQWVDLWGEGLAGILYQSGDGWRYRSPIRDAAQGGEGVDYGPEQPLPTQPVGLHQSSPLLTDMTGDGYLDWVITQPDMAGFFTTNDRGEWSDFIPWQAFPSEFTHPDRQLAALGGYLSDLSLIGPRSVRLYSNQKGSFAPPRDIPHEGDLPLFNMSPQELVAFSDVLGSGQSHLVRVRHNTLHCWPNLGHGQFGQPLLLAELPFDIDTFNPDQVSLVDLDGNGAADLVVAMPDNLLIFLNQSGNGFANSPIIVPLPAGERIDSLSRINFADLSGKGFSSLVLTQSHPQPRHYRLDLCQEKPWLLTQINDPVGSMTRWEYRSSAQEWLDEKAAEPDAVCHLPFPMQVVKRVETFDCISGNTLTQTNHYRKGWYDGFEREFGGFGHIIQHDAESAGPLARGESFSAPLIQHTFYHTGAPETPTAFWQDPAAPQLSPDRVVQRGEQQDSALVDPDPATQRSLNRALKGMLLRQETLASDNAIPYTISEQRYLLRVWQVAGTQPYAIIQSGVLETRQWAYDGIADDPQVQHQLLLSWDKWGQPLQQAAVMYPRRPTPACPYPADTPQESWWQESFDQQQTRWQLQVAEQSWITRCDHGWWRLGLPAQSASWALSIPESDYAVSEGISTEFLNASDGWLQRDDLPRTLLNWQRLHWKNDDQGLPLVAGLPHYSEQGELDDDALTAWRDWLTGDELDEALLAAHYYPGAENEPRWLLRSPISEYAPFSQFYRLQSQRINAWLPPSQVIWDDYGLQAVKLIDPVGLETTSHYDYRLLTPVRITDPQGTTLEAAYDALGRVRATSLSGTEAGVVTGYAPLAEHPFTINDFPTALADPAAALGGLESVFFYAPDNYRMNGEPVYSAAISADRYPGDSQRKIRLSLTFSDGFGRELQSKSFVEPGLAFVRDSEGNLELDEDGKPLQVMTEDRWLASARVEYNNKGEPVRQFQPYFVAGWRYASDDNMREQGWYSCLWYDAAGRPVDTLDARWHWSHTTYHPWYVTSEDANDTTGLTRPAWLRGCPLGEPAAESEPE